MQWLASISVRRPIFATGLILVVLVVGLVGYGKLNIDRFPNVDMPVVSVTTVLRGAAPEEIETELTDKIEESVNTISGIDELRSTSTEGVSQVFITFLLDKNVDIAAQEVRDHLATILADLPQGTELSRRSGGTVAHQRARFLDVQQSRLSGRRGAPPWDRSWPSPWERSFPLFPT